MHEKLSQRLFKDGVAGLTPELLACRGWIVHVATYPVLEVGFSDRDRTPIRARFRFEDWNEQPPSIRWLDATGRHLAELPRATQFHQGPHPDTGKAFMCMPGVREYHTHPSHLNDVWDSYRGKPDYDFGGIVTQVWSAWCEARE